MMSPRKLRLLAECLERNFITEEDRKSWVTDLRGMAKVMEWRQAEEKGDEGEMTWQPIETAPKDSSLMLLYVRRSGQTRIGLFNTFFNEWVTVPGVYTLEPTDWMPLPEPPK